MKAFVLAAVAALPLVAAAPAVDATLNRRTAGNVYLCGGVGFTEPCTNYFVGIGTDYKANCKPLPDQLYKNLGSAGPDRGAICRLFDDAHNDCTGSGLAILQSPGNPNLFGAETDTGHKAAFISCVTCTACEG